MKLSEQVKPISYLKAHAPEIIRTLADNRQPVVITLHGEAKAVLQDVGQYEETQETLALLKILALTNQQVVEGNVRPAAETFARIRQRLSKHDI
ncbi:type II toxin-antitoxin system Phd/YefM family antitoxin [Mesorhizobium sp. WSM3224]|uniref:type II toxin-antitoxin system Phd/YefM family antitoxin n=1 Tax=Mesorhizobium sp. WSM3224 TaxID=1040986 RepID=UPI0003FE8A18|nr:type II toxin-antitoxin system Phd/YefM family antitoxin [Mesorhizobium sp. WSM3224]